MRQSGWVQTAEHYLGILKSGRFKEKKPKKPQSVLVAQISNIDQEQNVSTSLEVIRLNFFFSSTATYYKILELEARREKK